MGQVELVEFGQGMPGQDPGVFRRTGEVDLVAAVRGDRRGRLAGELDQVLVREHQGQAVAAGLGADLVDGAGQIQEVLAFVDDQDGVAAGGFGSRAAGGGGLPHRGDDEAAEQSGGVVAEYALG